MVNDSDHFGVVVINGNEIKGKATLVDGGDNGSNNSNNGSGGGSNNSTNASNNGNLDNIHQLSVNGVTYYLKMLSGVLYISQNQEGLNSLTGDLVKIEGFVDGQFGINLEKDEDPKFGADPITNGWKEAEGTNPVGPFRTDPLTLDLDGDGVELVSLENSNTFFDLDAHGIRENVGL